MAILVDEPIWDWRGRKWAHLVSDSNLDELHDFAHRLGLPYLAFQGDHYDVHTDLRLRALDDGAHPVSGRQVVVALRTAGLRRRGPVDSWQWEWRWTAATQGAVIPHEVEPAVLDAIAELVTAGHPVEVGQARRWTDELVVVSTTSVVPVDPGLVVVDAGTTVHRSSGERGTYLEWRTTTA